MQICLVLLFFVNTLNEFPLIKVNDARDPLERNFDMRMDFLRF